MQLVQHLIDSGVYKYVLVSFESKSEMHVSTLNGKRVVRSGVFSSFFCLTCLTIGIEFVSEGKKGVGGKNNIGASSGCLGAHPDCVISRA